MTKEQKAKAAELTAAVEAADAARKKNDTHENRQAYKEAYNARSAFLYKVDPPKRSGYGSRAGKRQQAARRANSGHYDSRWK